MYEPNSSAVIEPLIKRKIFLSEVEVIQELLRDYMVRQVAEPQKKLSNFITNTEWIFIRSVNICTNGQ